MVFDNNFTRIVKDVVVHSRCRRKVDRSGCSGGAQLRHRMLPRGMFAVARKKIVKQEYYKQIKCWVNSFKKC